MTEIISILLLGFAVIIHPCTAAPNLAAMSAIWAKNGGRTLPLWMYIIGHALGYLLPATILTVLLKQGIINLGEHIDMHWTEPLLASILAIGGITLLYSALHSHHHQHALPTKVLASTPGAFLCGAIIALLFCPEAAFSYFGVLIPMATTHSAGLLLPAFFALATAIPMIILLVLMKQGSTFPERYLHTSSRRFNIFLGVIFLLSAGWMCLHG